MKAAAVMDWEAARVADEKRAAWFARWWADVSFNFDVRPLADGQYSVASKSQPGRRHRVNWDGGTPTCSHDHWKSGTVCSHIAAVAAYRDAQPVDSGPEPFDGAEPAPLVARSLSPITRQPEPFQKGDRVVYTSPRDGSQIQATIERISIVGGEEQATLKFANERLGKWDRMMVRFANLTPAPVTTARAA